MSALDNIPENTLVFNIGGGVGATACGEELDRETHMALLRMQLSPEFEVADMNATATACESIPDADVEVPDDSWMQKFKDVYVGTSLKEINVTPCQNLHETVTVRTEKNDLFTNYIFQDGNGKEISLVVFELAGTSMLYFPDALIMNMEDFVTATRFRKSGSHVAMTNNEMIYNMPIHFIPKMLKVLEQLV